MTYFPRRNLCSFIALSQGDAGLLSSYWTIRTIGGDTEIQEKNLEMVGDDRLRILSPIKVTNCLIKRWCHCLGLWWHQKESVVFHRILFVLLKQIWENVTLICFLESVFVINLQGVEYELQQILHLRAKVIPEMSTIINLFRCSHSFWRCRSVPAKAGEEPYGSS